MIQVLTTDIMELISGENTELYDYVDDFRVEYLPGESDWEEEDRRLVIKHKSTNRYYALDYISSKYGPTFDPKCETFYEVIPVEKVITIWQRM